MAIGGDSLKKGLMLLGVMVLIIVGLYASLMIGGLVIGSIAEVAIGGDVPVSTAMNTSLSGMETSYISDSESISGNTGLIIALVAIVVLVMVFGIKFSFGGKKGSSAME